MLEKLLGGPIDPEFARVGALMERVRQATGVMPSQRRRMEDDEFERLMLKSIKEGKIDPMLVRSRKTNDIVVD